MRPKATEAFKQELKAYASGIGIHSVGIASAEPFTAEELLLHRRREEGRYPAFVSKVIEARCNPDALLPGVKSIISIAVSYKWEADRHQADHSETDHDEARPDRAPNPDASPHGRISSYAWSLDYHRVLMEQLNKLEAFIATRYPEALFARAVDTAPPIDRAIAERAGVGWFGKNCCTYVAEYGSWVFLGELFTDLEIPADRPDTEPIPSCGDCTLCIDACPTGALSPFDLDPNRCISHLTQMSDSVPEELRPKMGRWIFGCDICQLVCPWNRDAKAGNLPEFAPAEGIGERPSLIPMLLMSKQTFNETWKPTAAGWRGRKTLQRNAAIAMGNAKDRRAIPALTEALKDHKPVVQEAAAWALQQMGEVGFEQD